MHRSNGFNGLRESAYAGLTENPKRPTPVIAGRASRESDAVTSSRTSNSPDVPLVTDCCKGEGIPPVVHTELQASHAMSYQTTNDQQTGAFRRAKSIQFLTERQAATVLAVSPRTLQSWRYKGISGPKYHRFRKCIRYELSSLIEWAESQGIQPR